MSNESRDAAAREIKRFVRHVVCDDWDFDPASSGRDGVRPVSSSSTSSVTGYTLSNNREVSEWRMREFDSSGSELEPQSSDHELDLEPPNALKATDDPGIERRRKRRRQMEEEMAWNDGLRVWMARRDAWCGARTRRQILGRERKRKAAGRGTGAKKNGASGTGDGSASSSTHPQNRIEGDESSNVLTAKTVASLSVSEREKINDGTQRRSQEQQDQEEEHSTAPDDETKPKGSTETSITEPDAQTSSKDPTKLVTYAADSDQNDEMEDDGEGNEEDDEYDDDDEELDEPLLPVAPSFISASNPIRATITPSIYPSIYTKVVVQGMTPTVPINLADLTKAMVQGWKTDGQWPPKPAVSSIVLEDNATVPKSDTAGPPGTGAGPSRRKNSITNAVRKVLHIGSHPFHRRSSSSHDASAAGNATAPITTEK